VADNIQVTEGVGRTVAADEVAGALHQKVKMEFGDENTATSVSEDTPLPVTGSLVNAPYDSIISTNPNATTEVYTYKLGAATQAIVTVTYTDATKAVLASVVKT
jgi:hypothetical protein